MRPIAEFSELGEFLDMPVRYYSSGMMVRLAFSIATAIEPEILIVDEVLSAGDLSFQPKARQRMQTLMSQARRGRGQSRPGLAAKTLHPRRLARSRPSAEVGPAAEVIAAYLAGAKEIAQRAA